MKALDLAKKRFPKLDINDPVSKLIGLLIKTNERAVLVFDKHKFVGVSDKHLLLKSKIDPSHFKVKKVTKKVPILKGHESIKELARLFFTSDVRILPIVKKHQVVGVVKDVDVVKQILQDKELRGKGVRIVMSRPFVVNSKDSLSKVLNIMRQKHVSRVPVVDKRNRLVGLVSFSDVMDHFLLYNQGKGERRGRGSPTKSGSRTIRAFRADKADLRAQPVSNFVSEPVFSSPNDHIKIVIKEMLQFNVNSVVLATDNEPVGIVTLRDMLKFLAKEITY